MWNADKLLAGDDSSLVSSTSKHSGAIKALQFNPKYSNLVATGGAQGELYITDLNDLSSPTRLGSTAARADDVDCLDWNKKVPHIMVSGSSGGLVTVWDMKTKKESLTLNNMGRRAVSAVVWDPDKPTRLMTAIPLEQEPLILVWDLRNANAPERTLRGHESGVLSLSWCAQDNDLLLSCGKDNRTLCWNPQTGQALGEFETVTNWTFQTRWSPHNPNLFATASFDGRISVQSLQNINSGTVQEGGSQGTTLDGEDFFSKAQSQPQATAFSLNQTPKWLERPVSASFGFGGLIVSIRQPTPHASRASKIEIAKVEVDSDVATSTNQFEQTVQKGDLSTIYESRISEARNDKEKTEWNIIQALGGQRPRKELVTFLGFDDAEEAADGLSKLSVNDKSIESTDSKIDEAPGKGHKRLSSMFETTQDGDFLSELAATKGTKTNNPFQIYTGNESEPDRRITRALMLGEFDKALAVCLQEDRMDDAFMIAICGGQSCIKKAQEAYFSKQSGGPNYLRLLAAVVGKNLWDVVHNAELLNWKEAMATLCTFADEREFPDLCEALGDRLEEQGQSQKDACVCFLAGSKLEKVVSLWLDELREHETAGEAEATQGSAFSVHAKGLQSFIEKVTVFRKVTSYQDDELSKTSDWKLDRLYNKYLEYSDILASHGQLLAAERYLDLIPARYPEADVARSRIKQATKKASATGSSTAQPATGRQKPLPAVGGYQPLQSSQQPSQLASNQPHMPQQPQQATAGYGQPGNAMPQNPYAPQQPFQTSNPYDPTGGYQSQQSRGPGMAGPQYNSFPSGPMAPPPRGTTQSPAAPPPSRAANMSNWNDIPDDFAKAPTSRRGTPGMAPPPVTSASNAPPPWSAPHQGAFPPPMAAPISAAQRATPPVPPPPKAGAPPPTATSSTPGAPPPPSPAPSQPVSSAFNAYAPSAPAASPNMAPGVMQPPIQRGPSPYNAPPSQAPPPNRYAPTQGSQSTGFNQPPSRGSGPGPGPGPQQASSYQPAMPPPNPYAPSQPQGHMAAPSSLGQAPPPPTGSQPGPISGQAAPPQRPGPPSQASSSPNMAQPEKKAAKPQSKYRKSSPHFPPLALGMHIP